MHEYLSLLGFRGVLGGCISSYVKAQSFLRKQASFLFPLRVEACLIPPEHHLRNQIGQLSSDIPAVTVCRQSESVAQISCTGNQPFSRHGMSQAISRSVETPHICQSRRRDGSVPLRLTRSFSGTPCGWYHIAKRRTSIYRNNWSTRANLLSKNE